MLEKERLRIRRHARIRKNLVGTANKPRLNVYRSLNNMFAQIIDDGAGVTIVAASTIDNDIKGQIKSGGNVEAAKAVGTLIGKRAVEKGIKSVIFDRGGYVYHGRVKALADAAREAGLDF